MQNIALPLGYSSKDTAPIKRFAEQLRKLGCQVRYGLWFGSSVFRDLR